MKPPVLMAVGVALTVALACSREAAEPPAGTSPAADPTVWLEGAMPSLADLRLLGSAAAGPRQDYLDGHGYTLVIDGTDTLFERYSADSASRLTIALRADSAEATVASVALLPAPFVVRTMNVLLLQIEGHCTGVETTRFGASLSSSLGPEQLFDSPDRWQRSWNRVLEADSLSHVALHYTVATGSMHFSVVASSTASMGTDATGRTLHVRYSVGG